MNKKLFVIVSLILFISVSAFAGTDYPSIPYKEFVVPIEADRGSHGSSIVELPDGELFAVWFAPASGSPESVIWGARRPVGAHKWTDPLIIHNTPGRSNKSPVLYLNQDKKLLLFWADEIKLPFKINKDILRMKTSGDFGHTWGEANNVGKLAWFLTRTHPIGLHDGRIILPIYTDLCTSSAAAISKDGGLTWDGPKYLLFFFGIQPTIIQRSDLSLFALTRSGMWPRLSWQAVSYDLGQSWKNQRCSNVNNPGFSLEMVKLRSGNVVLAFNDSKTDRSSLSLALSCDEGRTWPYVKAIECKAGHVYGYPSVIQDRYGLIHVAYSYNKRDSIVHFVTDERWIKESKVRVKGTIPQGATLSE